MKEEPDETISREEEDVVVGGESDSATTGSAGKEVTASRKRKQPEEVRQGSSHDALPTRFSYRGSPG